MTTLASTVMTSMSAMDFTSKELAAPTAEEEEIAEEVECWTPADTNVVDVCSPELTIFWILRKVQTIQELNDNPTKCDHWNKCNNFACCTWEASKNGIPYKSPYYKCCLDCQERAFYNSVCIQWRLPTPLAGEHWSAIVRLCSKGDPWIPTEWLSSIGTSNASNASIDNASIITSAAITIGGISTTSASTSAVTSAITSAITSASTTASPTTSSSLKSPTKRPYRMVLGPIDGNTPPKKRKKKKAIATSTVHTTNNRRSQRLAVNKSICTKAATAATSSNINADTNNDNDLSFIDMVYNYDRNNDDNDDDDDYHNDDDDDDDYHNDDDDADDSDEYVSHGKSKKRGKSKKALAGGTAKSMTKKKQKQRLSLRKSNFSKEDGQRMQRRAIAIRKAQNASPEYAKACLVRAYKETL